jgi:hypothetical protein
LAGFSQWDHGRAAKGGGQRRSGDVRRQAAVGSSDDQTSAFSSAPTIIVTPGAGRPAAPAESVPGLLSGGSKDANQSAGRPGGAQPGTIAGGLLDATPVDGVSGCRAAPRVIIVLVIYHGGGFGAGGQLLTIEADGGTLSASGIIADARDGLHRAAEGRRDQLAPGPFGFTFVGYTGEAPGGQPS